MGGWGGLLQLAWHTKLGTETRLTAAKLRYMGSAASREDLHLVSWKQNLGS